MGDHSTLAEKNRLWWKSKCNKRKISRRKLKGDTRGLLTSIQVMTQPVTAIMTSHCRNFTRTPGEYKRGNDFFRALYHNRKPFYVFPGDRECMLTPDHHSFHFEAVTVKRSRAPPGVDDPRENRLQTEHKSPRCGRCENNLVSLLLSYELSCSVFVIVESSFSLEHRASVNT